MSAINFLFVLLLLLMIVVMIISTCAGVHDLIGWCLSVVPSDRPSLQDILGHRWMQESHEQVVKKQPETNVQCLGDVSHEQTDRKKSTADECSDADVHSGATQFTEMTPAERTLASSLAEQYSSLPGNPPLSHSHLLDTVELCAAPESDRTVELCASPVPDTTVELYAAPLSDRTVELCTSPVPDRTVELCAAPESDRTVELCASPVPDRTVELCTSPVPDTTVELGAAPSSDRTVELGAAPSSDRTVELGAAPLSDRTVELCASLSSAKAVTHCTQPSLDGTVEVTAESLSRDSANSSHLSATCLSQAVKQHQLSGSSDGFVNTVLCSDARTVCSVCGAGHSSSALSDSFSHICRHNVKFS